MKALLIAIMILAGQGAGAARGQDAPAEPLDPATAAQYFAEFEAACARDGGRLWGVEICGPVLLVDPQTRRIIANQADAEGLLEPHGAVHIGALPADKPVANAPIRWAGQRWAMIMSSWLGKTPAERITVLAHESFHRVQIELGLFTVGPASAHLDEADGRYWLQLEWNALTAALAAEGEGRAAAVADAMAFRAARRARYPEAAERENRSEILEGLAQYTGMRIAGSGREDVAAYVTSRRAQWDGFTSSFAYLSGPLLGYLLDDADAQWRESVTAESDLGAMLADAMSIEPVAAAAPGRAAAYGGSALRAAEDAREAQRQAQRARWREALIDGPVLIVDLSVVTFASMDTRAVHPLGEGRTVFTVRDMRAEWGSLTVDGGAILEDRVAQEGRLSLAGASDDHFRGDGWTLSINDGWVLTPGEREGDLVLQRRQ